MRALEFDQVVALLAALAATPPGRRRLEALHPSTDADEVGRGLETTSEAVRFVAEHGDFPLRAPSDLDILLAALEVEGRALEPAGLLALGGYVESIEHTRAAVMRLAPAFPRLSVIAVGVASFAAEIADLRRQITPAGEVADDASPRLASIRNQLRRQRARLRTTLDSIVRGRDTAKYLQEQVVTDRNGRYVLLVRAEHRAAVPGIVHGASASGASLFLEPLQTVEINNDIVALAEQEAREVHRILLALSDRFRERAEDLAATFDAAIDLDVAQAKARLAGEFAAIAPALASDGTFELRGARHPLLIHRMRNAPSSPDPVPVDIRLLPPVRVLVIGGPNTGGKTVAIKTAGLLAAMAQSGLHIPVEKGSRLPVFQSIFADIGDEQSISASLSTFSGHIANVVAMERRLALPALVLLDEVGAGTDPAEGGALGTAIIEHFRRRGAHLIATTHYEALKAYASTTEGASSGAFGFDPETFAPTYRLVYGSQGRSLAIEIAARLGMPPAVIADARANLTEPQKLLADHLARVDQELRALEEERRAAARDRARIAETEQRLRAREEAVEAREARLRARAGTRVEEQLRDARREIDAVIEALKAKAAALTDRAALRLNAGGQVRSAGLSTGEIGEARADARAAIGRIAGQLAGGDRHEATAAAGAGTPAPPLAPGARVRVGSLGLEGIVREIRDGQAEVDVRGKRLRASVGELSPIAAPPAAASVRVRVDLQPREGSPSELNIIGLTVDQAIDRLDKFLDQATVGDTAEVRIVHGHGTGQLRRAVAKYLGGHPLVERFEPAPDNQGGGGATIVMLKD